MLTFSACLNPNNPCRPRKITWNQISSVVKRTKPTRHHPSKSSLSLLTGAYLHRRMSRPPHSLTNNIYGSGPGQPAHKSNIYSDKNKSTIFDEAPPQQPSNRPDRQRSNIFGTNESASSGGPTRAVSEKFKSNIFGSADTDDQSRRQPGTRSGLRGRLPSRNHPDSYRPSIAISLYSPLRLKGSNRTTSRSAAFRCTSALCVHC